MIRICVVIHIAGEASTFYNCDFITMCNEIGYVKIVIHMNFKGTVSMRILALYGHLCKIELMHAGNELAEIKVQVNVGMASVLSQAWSGSHLESWE